MTDTKLIAREPTEKMVQAAANAYLTCMSADVASDMRMALIVAHDAAPDLAPAPAPSEPTLSLRWQLAIAAMQGMLASNPHWVRQEMPGFSRLCFEWADAMIAAEGER